MHLFLSPSVFLDKESRVVGWRTGITGGAENEKSWQEENDRLTSAMEDLAEKMARRKRSRPGVSRGEHSSADWGYSYGGGQQVCTQPPLRARKID